MFQTRTRQLVAVALLLLVGWGLRVWLAVESPSVYWGDGIFQILEPGHESAFGYGITPLEFKKGLRSWLFPGMAAGLMWLGEPLGSGSWGYLTLIAAVFSALAVVPAWVAWRWADREVDLAAAALLAAVPALFWNELLYFGPKALFEVLTAHLFVGSVWLVHTAEDGWLRPSLAGLIFGLCFVSRPHLGPSIGAVGGAVLLFADDRYRRFSWLIVGATAGVAIGGALDAWTWGAPFHSIIANAHYNLIEGKASRWGTSPSWQYLVWVWEVSPVGALTLGAALLVGMVRRPLLAWPAVVLLVAHSGIPHKEYRFIYPTIVLGTVVLGLELARLVAWLDERFERPALTRTVAGLLAALVLVVSGIASADFNLRSTGKTGESTNWQFHRGGLKLFRQLSTRPELCGVGLLNFDWAQWSSGGYTYLHRDVPMVRLNNTTQLRDRSHAYDVVVAEGWEPERTSIADFELERCVDEFCLLSRSGTCEPAGDLAMGR
jgi:hypothetical protein